LTRDEIEQARHARDAARAMPPAKPYVPAKTSTEMTPHAAPPAPPAPPDPAIAEADAEGARIVAAEQEARAVAKGPTTIGAPLAQRQDELRAQARLKRQGG
jgi:hypothetical protein